MLSEPKVGAVSTILRTQATLYLSAHSITRASDLLLSNTMPSSYPEACAKQILTAKGS